MKETGKSLIPWGKPITGLNESYRTYVWPGGDSLSIPCPQLLVISDNGHRVVDEDGMGFYVAYGWLYIKWELDKEDHHFYFQRESEK